MSYTYKQLEVFAAYVNWALGGERMDLDEMGGRVKELKADNEALGNDWNTYRGHLSRLNELTGCCNLLHSMMAVEGWKDALNRVCKALALTDGKGLPDQPEFILDEIERRLMPEGMEWPRFEDGEPVAPGARIVVDGPDGDVPRLVDSLMLYKNNSVQVNYWGGKRETELKYVMVYPGGRVKRPPILAKDGKPIEVGQTLYGKDGHTFEVVALHHGDAYDVEVDGEWHVNACGEKEPKRVKAEWLTHEKPNPTDEYVRLGLIEPVDTWQQLLLDTANHNYSMELREFERRAKKLAGVSAE